MHRRCPLSHAVVRTHAVVLAVLVTLLAPMSGRALARGSAGTLIVNTNTTIGDGDLTYEGYDIIVRGATLTINGVHAFNSLTVERSAGNQPGVVTHTAGFENRAGAGMWLIVATDVLVQGAEGSLVASRLDVNGRGHPAASGPGAGITFCDRPSGGGHGGAGGDGSLGALGGNTYGDFAQPTSMGSGGGNDTCGTVTPGGAGGGVIRLSIAGTLTVDGSVTANGNSFPANQAAGGAGGSLWIECGGLFGSGTISANGGAGNVSWSGGGGGGRIAIHCETSSLNLANLRAFGGNGWQAGAAGTVWLNSAALPRPLLRIDNNGLTGAVTELSGTVDVPGDAIVAAGARVGPDHEDASLHVVIEGDVTIESGAAFFANGRGYPSASGPGAGITACDRPSGAAHGGGGGDGSLGALGGNTYGDFAQPTSMGSGGGNDTCGTVGSGGAGGGVIRLSAAGALTVDGSITANGNGLSGAEAAGGAGGSLWIECAELLGSGTITANGGNGNTAWSGGGGGGRIAIQATTLGMGAAAIQARGGNGWQRAGAGTVWLDVATQPRPLLRVDNGGNTTGAITELHGEVTVPGDVHLSGAGRVGPDHADPSLHLIIEGDVVVESGAAFFANGRGHPGESGPGAGVTSCDRPSGGGHGGAGGDGSFGALGGSTYGDFVQPTTMGSGGGADTCGSVSPGGAGGGVIRLSIAGTLTVDGSVTANGNSFPANQAAGGAGGSLWIACAGLFGSGTITASGGNGNVSWSGGGGGGRIAISAAMLGMSVDSIQAIGGGGWQRGGAGTAWLDVATALRPVLRVDNGDNPTGAITEFQGEVTIPGDVHLSGAGRLGPARQDPSLHLIIEGDAAIESGAAFVANGRGHPAASGPGAGMSACDRPSGGGHGGAGGNGSGGAVGGSTYGDFAQPTTMGSGGGTDTCGTVTPGGAGGGVIRLSLAGTLTVDGSITANGNNLPANQAAGGAGGSLWIECAGVFGSGTITANGGNGNVSWSGGGGGGRIAIYCCAVELPSTNIQVAGGSGWQAGSAGTIGIFSDTIDFLSLPAPAVVSEFATAIFSVTASGDGALAYQWFRNNQPLDDGGNISGATSPMLTITDVACVADAGAYRVRVTDSCGDAFTPAVALVVPIVGDLNGDCAVDGADLGLLLSSWGACAGCPADLNGDGIVDGADLGVLLSAWGG
ncbi:MAG TPA: hypothetical protein PKC43_01530 [Phycisphaerales bacterium]|nr:hypothetical protein [Phycisphaerales bacterium]HMP36106.1 hypothetical protein [Phycisphaerales bacterium]